MIYCETDKQRERRLAREPGEQAAAVLKAMNERSWYVILYERNEKLWVCGWPLDYGTYAHETETEALAANKRYDLNSRGFLNHTPVTYFVAEFKALSLKALKKKLAVVEGQSISKDVCKAIVAAKEANAERNL